MKQTVASIQNKVGIHARPASLLVNVVKKYDCKVKLEKDEKICELNGIMDLMRLQCKMGDELTIICEGKDEDACLNEMVALIDSKFGEA